MAERTNQLVLQVENLKKYYSSSGTGKLKQSVHAVDGVSFTLKAGEVLGIIGESGCGKSTLGKLLIQLEEPTGGSILYNGEKAADLLKKDRFSFRKLVQMVFQNPFDTFPPGQTIEKILTRVLILHHIGGNYKERIKLCENALESAGLVPAQDFLRRYPHELSGGQLQRISIIRTMLLHPRFIVADEPVSMLDVSVRADIINILLELSKKQNTSLVFISHDLATTRYISDRVAVMYLGRIVESGNTEDVIQNPMHPYTKALLYNCASIDPNAKAEFIEIPGEPPTPSGERVGCYFAPRCFAATDRCFYEYPQTNNLGGGHCVSCFQCEHVNQIE